MTSWEPYPTAATQPGTSSSQSPTAVTYEPYPTTPQAPSYTVSYATSDLSPYHHTIPAYEQVTRRPSVSAVQAMKLAGKNWNVYFGRASRSEFWWPAIAWALVNGVVDSIGDRITAAGSGGIAGAISGILGVIMLALLVPLISLGVRRLHDTGRSGWMLLLGLIPVVGPLILIALMVQKSSPSGASYDNPNTTPFGPEDL